MVSQVVLTDAAAKDMQLICDYFLANQQGHRIEPFFNQMEKVFQRISQSPDAGSWPSELLELGIHDYREIFSHPYRVVYYCENNTAYIMLIADARRDLDTLLQMRFFT
ncbi:MAG: type II toxin-antitoxin system RelE/ParE family toxin [Planctomycetaceae bacterium]|nr:type II toxin-antitoxin system RelE/ParE family toxin [Planctomycetaceae bacterium]